MAKIDSDSLGVPIESHALSSRQVDAQNKFMGKSFEIRPTGVAHADLIIPTENAGGSGYPAADGPTGKGKVVEHFSWKKVTTSVSGFILGQPTIDHYGDMAVST
jgi:oxysterol-binding protein 1